MREAADELFGEHGYDIDFSSVSEAAYFIVHAADDADDAESRQYALRLARHSRRENSRDQWRETLQVVVQDDADADDAIDAAVAALRKIARMAGR